MSLRGSGPFENESAERFIEDLQGGSVDLKEFLSEVLAQDESKPLPRDVADRVVASGALVLAARYGDIREFFGEDLPWLRGAGGLTRRAADALRRVAHSETAQQWKGDPDWQRAVEEIYGALARSSWQADWWVTSPGGDSLGNP